MTTIILAHKDFVNNEKRIILDFPKIKKVLKLLQKIQDVQYDEKLQVWHLPNSYKLKDLNDRFKPELFFTWDNYRPLAKILIYPETNKFQVKLPNEIYFDFNALGFPNAHYCKDSNSWTFDSLDSLQTIKNVIISLGAQTEEHEVSQLEALEQVPEIQKFRNIVQKSNLGYYAKNAYIFHVKQFILQTSEKKIQDFTQEEIEQHVKNTAKKHKLSPLQVVYMASALEMFFNRIYNKKIDFSKYKILEKKLHIEEFLEIVDTNIPPESQLLFFFVYTLGVPHAALAFSDSDSIENTERDIRNITMLKDEFLNLVAALPDKNFFAEKAEEDLLVLHANTLTEFKLKELFLIDFENIIAKSELKDSSKKSYTSIFKSLIAKLNYIHPLHWNAQLITDTLKHLQQEKQFAPETIQQYITAAKMFYERTTNKKFFNIKLEDIVGTPKEEKQTSKELLSEEEIIKIFESFENIKHFALIFFIAFTGLKISDAINLLLKNIDLDKKLITFQANKKTLKLSISDNMASLLKHYLEQAQPQVFLFEGYKGPYSTSGVRKILFNNVEKAGIEKHVSMKVLIRSIIETTGGTNTIFSKQKPQPFSYDQKIQNFEKLILDKINFMNLN